MDEVLIVESDVVLYVEGEISVIYVEVESEPGFVISEGEQGPPGEGVAGGTSGQLLGIGEDNVTRHWVDPPESLPAGGTTGQVLTKQSDTDGDAEWEDAAPGGVWGQITGEIADQSDLMASLVSLRAFAASHG